MATVKIATLFVRTLAKPIATQLRTQAAQHPSFRRICVGIAQRLHRIEMGMRWDLITKVPRRDKIHQVAEGKVASTDANLATGKEAGQHSQPAEGQSSPGRPKVRPLDEAKAIANGATFISEAFLFSIAAALILGESWRTSTKHRKQRDRTEERVEEVARAVEAIARQLGLDTGLKVESLETENDDQLPSQNSESQSLQQVQAPHASYAALQQAEEIAGLRKAVDGLLHLAISGGLIQGQDALHLNTIMQGVDQQQPQKAHQQQDTSSEERTGLESGKTGQPPATYTPAATPPSPVLQQLAAHRAKQLAEMSRRQAEA